MALAPAAAEIGLDHQSRELANLGYIRYLAPVAATGTGEVVVRAAVTGKQIYAKGLVAVDGACIVDLRSATSGAVIKRLVFVAAGSQRIPVCIANAGEGLYIISNANVNAWAEIETLPVSAGMIVPDGWRLGMAN